MSLVRGGPRNVLGCLLGSQKLPAGQRPAARTRGSSGGLDARGHACYELPEDSVVGPRATGAPPPPTSNLPVGVGGACWRTQGGGTGEHGVPGVAFSMTSLCPDWERAPLPVVPSIPETHLRLRHTDRQFHRCRVSPRRAHPLPHVQRDRGARGRCASPLNTMKVMNISSPNCQNNCFIYRAELLQGASQ